MPPRLARGSEAQIEECKSFEHASLGHPPESLGQGRGSGRGKTLRHTKKIVLTVTLQPTRHRLPTNRHQ